MADDSGHALDQVGELERLGALRASGVLNDQEFDHLKDRLLNPVHSELTVTEPSAGRSARVSLLLSLLLVVAAAGGVVIWLTAHTDSTSRRTDSEIAAARVETSVPRAGVSTAPPTTLSRGSQCLSDYLDQHGTAVRQMGSAMQTFEGSIEAGASDDAIGRASIDLYNSLILVPSMPANCSTSAEFNIWLNAAIVSADQISDEYLRGDIRGMYEVGFGWGKVQTLYAEWWDELQVAG